MSITRVLVIGAGLIGGSLIKRMLELKDKYNISVFDPYLDDLSKDYLLQNKVIIELSLDNQIYDIGIFATAPKANTYNQFAEYLTKSCDLITDVSSVKADILNCFKSDKFISSHPIAGKSIGGFKNSDASLFNGKTVILTKINPQTSLELLDKAIFFWYNIIGKQGKIKHLSSTEHDDIYAKCSHLPQLISFVLGDFIVRNNLPQSLNLKLKNDFLKQEGFFRLCSSDVKLWQDIFLANAVNLKALFAILIEDLFADKTHHLLSDINYLCFRISQLIKGYCTDIDQDFKGTGFATITSLCNQFNVKDFIVNHQDAIPIMPKELKDIFLGLGGEVFKRDFIFCKKSLINIRPLLHSLDFKKHNRPLP
jgi:prephenate dehydrogenase